MDAYAKRNLWILNALAFLSSFRLFDPVLAIFIASVTGSYGLAMTALATMHLSASFFEIPTGVFSDRIGRRMTMIYYHVSYALAVFILYFAHTSIWVFIALIVSGFGMAMRTGATTAYIYENLEVLGRVDEFKSQEGARQAIGRWALVISGLLGSVIIYYYDIRTSILIAGFVLGSAGVLSFWLHELGAVQVGKSNIYSHLKEALGRFRTDTTLRDFTIAKVIAIGAANSEYRFRALLFGTIMPDWLVNVLGTTSNIVTGVTMKYSHWIVHKVGFNGVLVVGELIDRALTVVFTLVGTVTSFFTMNFITSAVYGAREIASEDLLQERYSKHERATMGSLVGLGSSLLYAVLSISIGFVADAIGLVYTMLIMQVIMASAAFYFYKGITSRSAGKV